MPATVLCKLAHIILKTTGIMMSIPQMKIARHREFKRHAQGDS